MKPTISDARRKEIEQLFHSSVYLRVLLKTKRDLTDTVLSYQRAATQYLLEWDDLDHLWQYNLRCVRAERLLARITVALSAPQ